MCFSRRAGTGGGWCSLAEAQQVFPVSRTGARLSLAVKPWVMIVFANRGL